MGYWENTTYVKGASIDGIVRELDRLFATEGMHRVTRPSRRTRLLVEPMQYESALLNDLWGIAVFPGAEGWSVIKTAPLELLSERAPGMSSMRLASLCKTLHVSAIQCHEYDGASPVLVEVDPDGSMLASGYNSKGEDPFTWNDEQLDEDLFEPQLQLDAHAASFGKELTEITARALSKILAGDNARYCDNLTSVGWLIEHHPLCIAGGVDAYYRWPGPSRQRYQACSTWQEYRDAIGK